MTLYKDRYRIESTRIPGWDYTSPAWYFVTICTAERRCTLSSIEADQILLSPAGSIVAEEWQRTPHVRPNVSLDAWIVMPNHIHGIIVIEPPPVETTCQVVFDPTGVEDSVHHGDERPRRPARSSLQAGSLGAIVGQFKAVCTKRIRAEVDADFAWQGRFYEHIIRNETSLARIRTYIEANPYIWYEDTLHPTNWPTPPR